MSETVVSDTEPEEEAKTRPGERSRGWGSLIEAVLDNLPAWAFVALAISALYLVWATLVVLEKYVGGLPGVAP